MTDEEVRHNWRKFWLSSIAEFADFETQKRKWLDAENTNPHWSFVEYMCNYFDDLGLQVVGYEGRINEGFVTKEEVAAVENFDRIADSYASPTNDYDHKAILSDPKWHEVVQAAQEAQQRLLALISDTTERKYVANVDVAWIEARWRP